MLIALACSGACGGGKAPAAVTLPRMVAHRGASLEAPENTLASLRRAWELGVESCEIDVRVTADGAVVLMHDATTERTAGVPGAVADATLDELRALDVGRWKAARFAGERIPTLAEALAATPQGRMLFVEIKSGPETVETIARVIAEGGAEVALQAYDAETLAAASRLLPDVPAYWTVDPPLDADRAPRPYPPELIDDAKRRGFHGLALDHAGVDAAYAQAVLDAGLLLDVWTVNDAAAIARWRERGARWIETDAPHVLAP